MPVCNKTGQQTEDTVERESKKHNAVLFGLPNSDDDLESVCELFDTYGYGRDTQTWLNSNISDGILCNLSEYNAFRSDRVGRKNGGVAIFAKKSLTLSRRNIDC
uniref:RRM domain-containing protein n=1 Tax=Romanomermis culicivorax TaxID=13658 RepID=A0A915JP27_ROMCU